MKKLFISQPMKLRPRELIEDERKLALEDAKSILGDNNLVLIDSYIEGAPNKNIPLWSLGESLTLLSTADVVYFAKGWDQARGCRVEHICAVEYGIPCIYYSGK